MYLLGGEPVKLHNAFRGGLIFLCNIPETTVVTNDKAYNARHFLKTFQILGSLFDPGNDITAGRGEDDRTNAENHLCFDFRSVQHDHADLADIRLEQIVIIRRNSLDLYKMPEGNHGV